MGQGLSVTGGATKMAIQIIGYLENDQRVAVLRKRLPRLHTAVHNKSVEAKAASTFRGQRDIALVVNEHQKTKEKFEDLVQDLKCQGGAVVEVKKVCEVRTKMESLHEDLATPFSMTKGFRECGIKAIEDIVNFSIRDIINKYSVKAVKEEDITVLWESNRLLHIDYIFWQHVDAICGYAIVKHVEDNTRPKTKTFSYVISSGGVGGGGGGGDVATGSRSRGAEDNGDGSGLATSCSAGIGGGIGVTPEAGSLVLFIATADVNDSISALLGSNQKHSFTPSKNTKISYFDVTALLYLLYEENVTKVTSSFADSVPGFDCECLWIVNCSLLVACNRIITRNNSIWRIKIQFLAYIYTISLARVSCHTSTYQNVFTTF